MTCSSHKLVVIHHHGETFGRMLSDKRLYDTESLTRSRCSNYPCSSKAVAYRNPPLTEFTLIVVSHGDIYAVFILDFFFTLFKTFILEVETVFHQSLLDEL